RLEHHCRETRASATTRRNAIWTLPTPAFVKINVDGEWRSSCEAGLGHTRLGGILLGGERCHLLRSSVEETEAEEALSRQVLDKDMDLQNIMKSVKSTCKIYPTTEEIWRLSSSLAPVQWTWIHKEANKAAHKAACLGIEIRESAATGAFVAWLKFSGIGFLRKPTKQHKFSGIGFIKKRTRQHIKLLVWISRVPSHVPLWLGWRCFGVA
ncbi:hypothetical protein C1H46_040806, partial [Malus baccata]